MGVLAASAIPVSLWTDLAHVCRGMSRNNATQPGRMEVVHGQILITQRRTFRLTENMSFLLCFDNYECCSDRGNINKRRFAVFVEAVD